MLAHGLHISRRTLQGLASVALLMVVTFFGVTRTQLGRDAIAREVERRFALTTEASLSIGSLTGNLVQSFTATDIRVLDHAGNTILAVDTVFMRPSWEDLIRRRFDSARIHFKGPQLRVVQDGDGHLLWRDLLPISESDSVEGDPWSFDSARIIVDDGTLIWQVRDGTNFVDTVATAVQLDARVERADDGFLVDVLEASGLAARQDVQVVTTNLQAVLGQHGVRVIQARVSTTESDVRFDGSFSRGVQPALELQLDRSTVSFDEVKRLFPFFPLSGRGEIQLSGSGTLDDFVVSSLEVLSGSSKASMSGTVRGLPDSAAFDIRLAGAPFVLDDLKSLAPKSPVSERLTLDSLYATAYLSGTMSTRGDSLIGEANLELTARGAGGSGDFNGQLIMGPGGSVSLIGDLQGSAIDVGKIYLTGIGGSSLNGLASLELATTLEDLSLPAVQGTISGVFRQSRLGRSRIDLLRLNATLGPLQGEATARLVQPTGVSTASLDWRRGPAGEVHGVLESGGLDLGPLLGNEAEFATVIAGRLETDLHRSERWFGTIALATDSASVRRDTVLTHTGPQTVSLTLRLPPDSLESPESSVQLLISGSVASGHIVMDRHPSELLPVGRFWRRAFVDAALREAKKPYLPSSLSLDPIADLEVSLLRDEVRRLLGQSSISADGTIQVADVSSLTAWIPGTAQVSGMTRSRFGVVANLDTMELEAHVTADSLSGGSVFVYGGQLDLTAAALFHGPVEDVLKLSLRSRADSLVTPASNLPDASLALELADRRGRLLISGARGDRLGPYAVAAGIHLLDDRVRLELDTLTINARQYSWSLAEPTTLDLYSDAISVSNLSLVEPSGAQLLRTSGTLSDSPVDTLRLHASGLRLEGFTEFVSLRRDLGGAVNADLKLTGGWAHPRAAGLVNVPEFVLDDWILGAVRLESTMIPGQRDIRVALDIEPSQGASIDFPTLQVLDNRLSIGGTVRFPEGGDQGQWDLAANVTRADLFFLKYAFNESVDRVEGFASGPGTVTGPFAKPVVDARLEVADGAFGVPRVGLEYTFSASTRIDAQAIHIERGRLIDQEGGFADVSGPMLLNDYLFFSFDLEATLIDLLVMNRAETPDLPFYGFIRGTGTAFLTGPIANATLRVPDGRTRPDSELFIPLVDAIEERDEGFIIFADSTGRIPDLERLIRRPFFLARRASAERKFLDGLDMDLNIEVPRGSLIHLVIDPLLGDVINAESTGRVQLRRSQGEFEAFGQMEVLGGDYLFTAGEVFVRRFMVQPGGTISWVGDPVNARLDIPAAFRTRASAAGLNDVSVGDALIPLVVELRIGGQVLSPIVDLGLSIDRSNQSVLGDYQALEAKLNQPDRAAEYVTSVLLTNSFQLTTENLTAQAGEQLAFNSVSQLVSSQLSRFLDAALPNVDFTFGLQGERAEDLDITYGVALRLLDERLVIRGEGIYQGSNTDNTRANIEGIQGEFVVEVRLSPSVAAQVFFRREGDILQNADLTNTAGAGVTYQTDFPSWRRALRRLFGRSDSATRPTETSDGDGP